MSFLWHRLYLCPVYVLMLMYASKFEIIPRTGECQRHTYYYYYRRSPTSRRCWAIAPLAGGGDDAFNETVVARATDTRGGQGTACGGNCNYVLDVLRSPQQIQDIEHRVHGVWVASSGGESLCSEQYMCRQQPRPR